MKRLFIFIFGFSTTLIALTSCSGNQQRDREKAIAKQVESVYVYMDAIYKSFSKDSLILAMDLIDESIALDSTYVLAYQTKADFLKREKQYEEALQVINIAFNQHLEVENPILFLNRGIIYDKLGRIDLAKADYEAAIPIYNEWAERSPDDFNALIIRIALIYLLKGSESGILACEQSLNKQLNDWEQKEIETYLDMFQNKSRSEFVECIN